MMIHFFEKRQQLFAAILFYSMLMQLAVPHFAYARSKGNYVQPTQNSNTYNPYNNRRVADTNNLNAKVETQKYTKRLDPTLDIDGPGQPEMSGFKPASVDNMVNLFSGDFNYNIPLLDVDGYPINIYYTAGNSMEQEASWVGLGWNINPGTISRNMRGVPDDFQGEKDKITKTQNLRPDVSISIDAQPNLEALGIPVYKIGKINFTAALSLNYNNKTGFGMGANIGAEFSSQQRLFTNNKTDKTTHDTVSLNTQLSGTLSLSSKNGTQLTGGLGADLDFRRGVDIKPVVADAPSSTTAVAENTPGKEIRQYKASRLNGVDLPLNFARASFTPSFKIPYISENQIIAFKLGPTKPALFSNMNFSGSYSKQYINPAAQTLSKPSYGMLYMEKANDKNNAVLDFNRINEGVVNKRTSVISMPTYTYDVFNISGEGTGGSFRAYRGSVGFSRDVEMKSISRSSNVDIDLGASGTPPTNHNGVKVGVTNSQSTVKMWEQDNLLRHKIPFTSNEGLYEGVYFKNPQEMTITDESYYKAMGEDNLVRPYFTNGNEKNPRLATHFQQLTNNQTTKTKLEDFANYTRKNRDKRTQIISYLTADDATRVGFNKWFYSYNENVFLPPNCVNDSYRKKIERISSIRKPHHISEVSVLEGDGRRFIYGVPAYNFKQVDVQFSIEKTGDRPFDASKNLITYKPEDNSIANKMGKDYFYQKEEIPSFAHSFLLTQILSPDYVDVKDDGITDDDLGTAISFNYSRMNETITGQSTLNVGAVKWRTPMSSQPNKANYIENVKTDDRDDKASYSYGTKELWYLHSLVSKNMVATFTIESRKDVCPASNEDGGVETNGGQRRLKKIDLFTKADFIKNGAAAKPVKTVHFGYSYKLCGNNPSNNGQAEYKQIYEGGQLVTKNVNENKGKLTLDSIWFSYNGNPKQSINKYRFKYSNLNPNYNNTEIDRWGNYKPAAENPTTPALNNQEYPYALQDKVKADNNAKAWNLEKILLPSGSQIQIDYESDSYAFVQDKEASVMTPIVGFGNSPTATPTQNLYEFLNSVAVIGAKDNFYVFADVVKPTQLGTNPLTKADVKKFYLQGFQQMLLKIFVNTIDNKYEPITTYTEIDGDNYGVVGGSFPNRIWFKVLETERGKNPIFETIAQYIKDYLPKVAYPSSDIADQSAPKQVISALLGMFARLRQDIIGFENAAKSENKFREVLLTKSFVRLNEPNGIKYGGGYRVKKVTIKDNWDKMTQSYKAEYGQEYNYEVNRDEAVTDKISSGVATYEPGVGNEENPFKAVIKNYTKQNLNPWILGNNELPIAETFYPSPSIGYRRVTVRSIRNNTNTSATLAKIKSGIGFQESRFFTAKEFPITVEYSNFDDESNRYFKTNAFRKMIVNKGIETNTRTQGFRVVLNDMHGKQRFQASYAETDDKTPINSTQYYYKSKLIGKDKYQLLNTIEAVEGANGIIKNKIVGKDIEVTTDFAEHTSKTWTVGQVPMNLDAVLTAVGYIPLINIFRSSSYNEMRYRAATTLKVVNEFGIIDSVVNNDKGSVVSTENLLYDAETGQVLVSKTKNEFKKPIYQVNYPSHWLKNEMRHAYHNIDAVYNKVTFVNGKLVSGVANPNNVFVSGDEIYVQNIGDNMPVAESEACIQLGYSPQIQVMQLASQHFLRIWALDVTKDTRNTTKEFIFINRKGEPITATNASIRIIRSGNRNILGASAGSVVCLEEPWETLAAAGDKRLKVDDTKRIVNASAVEFKEKWRTENIFNAKEEIVYQKRYAPKHILEFVPKENNPENGVYSYKLKGKQNRQITGWSQMQFTSAANQSNINFNHLHRKNSFRTQVSTWVYFDLGSLPTNAKIVSAKLNIAAHKDSHLPNIHPYDDVSDISHSSSNPQFGGQFTNTGVVERPLMTWSNLISSSNRKNAFDIDNQFHKDGVIIPSTGYGAAQVSYNELNGGDIDILSLFKNLVSASRNTSLNYAPALRFRYYSGVMTNSLNKDEKVYQCFSLGTAYVLASYYNPTEILPAGQVPPDISNYIEVDEVATKTTLCLSDFDKQMYNPYVTGILGNWRGWRSYVFNGQRREQVPTQPTNIVKDGVIQDFENFWTIGGEVMVKATTTKWQWNSEITQYNRKGIEVENRDPLGRYNAGLYGYQQSLPIAVANNSKYKEIAFDGFEDYHYNADPCLPFCDPNIKHFETGITKPMLTTATAHTGKYSVPVNAGESKAINLPIAAHNTAYVPDVRISHTNTQAPNAIVTPKGIGLKAYYSPNENFVSPQVVRIDPEVNLSFQGKTCNNCYGCSNQGNLPIDRCNYNSVLWKGSIQAEKSANYNFLLNVNNPADDWAELKINGIVYTTSVWGGATNSIQVALIAGQLYPIEIRYKNYKSYGSINLLWRNSITNVTTPVPTRNLYPEGQEALANGTVQSAGFCVKPEFIKSLTNPFIDKFSLTPNEKMIAGLWVKVGANRQVFTSYVNEVNIKIKNGTTTLATLTPKETIIEGWQLFEATFTVPTGATALSFDIANASGSTLYVDDIRLHPYAANMKSFVYDPVSLRLSSELDENNFASFYEYDEDGTLIRVKKETKEGIKTITETRSSLQKVITTID